MDTQKIQDAIEVLQERSDELGAEKKAIDVVLEGLIRQFGLAGLQPTNQSKNLPSSVVLNGSITDKKNRDKNFPKDKPLKEQIIYLFRNHLKQANRYSEIQRAYNECSGLDKVIREDLLAFRREENPALTAVKFNNNSNVTYTGLTEWIVQSEVGPSFHPDFFNSNMDKFPKGIYKSEWADSPVPIQENKEGYPVG